MTQLPACNPSKVKGHILVDELPDLILLGSHVFFPLKDRKGEIIPSCNKKFLNSLKMSHHEMWSNIDERNKLSSRLTKTYNKKLDYKKTSFPLKEKKTHKLVDLQENCPELLAVALTTGSSFVPVSPCFSCTPSPLCVLLILNLFQRGVTSTYCCRHGQLIRCWSSRNVASSNEMRWEGHSWVPPAVLSSSVQEVFRSQRGISR